MEVVLSPIERTVERDLEMVHVEEINLRVEHLAGVLNIVADKESRITLGQETEPISVH